MERDIPRLLKALRAESYYGAKVSFELDEPASPVQVTIIVSLGSPYILGSVMIQRVRQGEARQVILPKPGDIGLQLEKPARAQAIIDAQGELIRWLKRQGFPFSRIAERRVVVDHAIQTVTVTFRIDPGPSARFGPTKITSLKTVNEGFLHRKIPWKEGDPFNVQQVERVQKRLFLCFSGSGGGSQLGSRGRAALLHPDRSFAP